MEMEGRGERRGGKRGSREKDSLSNASIIETVERGDASVR